ncbi:MAG: peroxiredoxin-like family protein [Opitutales bacterium]
MTLLIRLLFSIPAFLLIPLSAAVPTAAEDAKPLGQGEQVPAVSLIGLEGDTVDLPTLVSEKPTVLIFYRGGWCPFCTKHLSAVQKIMPRIEAMGFQVVGISPDRPEKNMEAGKKHALNYKLLSDSSADAMKAFGVAFKVPESLVSKYKNEYGIDIEGDSGETHNILPVPAFYVVGTDGVIRFAHFDPNYRKRLEPGKILTELKRAKAFENM